MFLFETTAAVATAPSGNGRLRFAGHPVRPLTGGATPAWNGCKQFHEKLFKKIKIESRIMHIERWTNLNRLINTEQNCDVQCMSYEWEEKPPGLKLKPSENC